MSPSGACHASPTIRSCFMSTDLLTHVDSGASVPGAFVPGFAGPQGSYFFFDVVEIGWDLNLLPLKLEIDVTIKTSFGDVPIGHAILDRDHATARLGGGKYGFKAEVVVQVDIETSQLTLDATACIPFIGCRSGTQTLTLPFAEDQEPQPGVVTLGHPVMTDLLPHIDSGESENSMLGSPMILGAGWSGSCVFFGFLDVAWNASLGTSESGITVSLMTPFGNLEIGRAVLSPADSSVTISGGTFGFKGQVTVRIDFSQWTVSINATGCAPLAGCDSASKTFHIGAVGEETPTPEFGFGWVPDPLSDEDHYFSKADSMHRPLGVGAKATAALQSTVDLSGGFGPIRNQGSTNSCTGQAASAMFEFMESTRTQKFARMSPMFLYKVERNLMGRPPGEDKGAYIRTAMQALVVSGIPDEAYWAWDPAQINTEAPAFVYSVASNNRAVEYLLLDDPSTSKPDVVDRIKVLLASHVPAIFGFYLFNSSMTSTVNSSGKIPMPSASSKPFGGHAVVAVGYDDNMTIPSAGSSPASRGAFKIRNSWGTGWGDQGYGWLPYDYVLGDLATDWWVILDERYVEMDQFTFGASPA